MTTLAKQQLSSDEIKSLLNILQVRFRKNEERHKGVEWAQIQKRLESNADKLRSLHLMEITGGEPDVVIGLDNDFNEFIFVDCTTETPKGRRSVCYDPEALASRKEYKPANSAVGMAADFGIELLNETQYRNLQKFGCFDAKTSSWLKTPENIRKLRGAIFGDFRYGTVFIYHNGAESYYAARGFRGLLRV
ncbi:MAG: DUF4256 domain-containing protein [Paludibacteraceae bacterium]